MLIDDGRIRRVGARAEIERRIGPARSVIDARQRVVMPGFVDAHTHPVFAGNRADEFEQRVRGRHATPRSQPRAAASAPPFARRGPPAKTICCSAAQRYVDWFLRGGTTTIEAKSGYGLTLEDECKLLRVIGRLEPHAHRCRRFSARTKSRTNIRDRPAEYVDLVVEEMLPAGRREHLAEYCDIFCEPRNLRHRRQPANPDRGARARAGAAHARRSALRFRRRVRWRPNWARPRPIIWNTPTRAASLALQTAGVQPVLLPGSVYALGSTRYPDARAMIEAGLAVVLATDFNPGSSPTPSMPMILSLACTQMKMTPAEAITAATINAAYSLDRGEEIGSLEPGKRADFVIHDCSDYREIAYFFGVPSAEAVYLEGRPVWARLKHSD